MTKKDVVDHLYLKFGRSGLSKMQLEMIFNEVFSLIKENLLKGALFKIRGFGSFFTEKRESRFFYLPSKDENVLIEGSFIVKFRPSSDFKKRR